MDVEQDAFGEGDVFHLASGREVALRRLHVQEAAIGVLEGVVSFVRDRVVSEVPIDAESLFGPDVRLVLFEPPPGQLPTYRVLVELISYSPVLARDADAPFSSLVVGWFAEELPSDLLQQIGSAIRTVAWDEHAVNGYY